MNYFFAYNWKRFILTILFWIFAWTLHDTIMERYELSYKKKIIIYTTLLFTVSVLIRNTKDFF